MTSKWFVQLMGELAIHGNDTTIRSFRTQKTGALLAYLAYFPQTHSREVLIDRFWPDSNLQRGRQSLSTALSALRAQLEPMLTEEDHVIQSSRFSVRLNPDLVSTDVRQFEAALRAAQQAKTSTEAQTHYQTALSLYNGTLLPGYYDNWITSAEQYLTSRYVSSVLAVVEQLMTQGKSALALKHLQQATHHRPYDEDIAIHMVQVLAATGRVSEAIGTFESFRNRLRANTGSNPGERMDLLYQELRKQVPVVANPSTQALPVSLNPLFGRDDLLQDIVTTVTDPDVRLVTLTGTGGIGKTRLILATAQALQDKFSARVWYVPLADITPGILSIEETLQDKMHIEVTPGTSPLNGIRRTIGEQPALLVLDNTEHILDATADLCQQLLISLPLLTVLVASRQRLNLSMEHTILIGSLGLPPNRDCPPEKLMEVPSVQMFAARARAASSDFKVTETNARDIAALMHGLEGIPLAIELAASRAGLLSPAQMVEALDDRLGFLSAGPRDNSPRHRTLRACIAWSYDLLPQNLQNTFCQLAVFLNGWALAGAEAVLEVNNPLDVLSYLQSAALIQAHTVHYGDIEERRYGMLASLRDFALEEIDTEHLAVLQERHAVYIASVVTQGDSKLRTWQREAWLVRLQHEHDDFAFATHWSIDNDRLDVEAQIVGGLHTYWMVRGYWEIAAHHHHALLERLAKDQGTLPEQDEIQQRTHCHYGMALLHLGEFDAASEQFQEVLAAERSSTRWLAQAQHGLGLVAMKRNRPEEARTALKAAQALAIHLKDDHEFRIITKHLVLLEDGHWDSTEQ